MSYRNKVIGLIIILAIVVKSIDDFDNMALGDFDEEPVEFYMR